MKSDSITVEVAHLGMLSVFSGQSVRVLAPVLIRGEVLLYGRRPQPFAHSLLVGVIVVRLRAVWPTDVVVLVVHASLRLVLRLWVNVVLTVAWRRKSLL